MSQLKVVSSLWEDFRITDDDGTRLALEVKLMFKVLTNDLQSRSYSTTLSQLAMFARGGATDEYIDSVGACGVSSEGSRNASSGLVASTAERGAIVSVHGVAGGVEVEMDTDHTLQWRDNHNVFVFIRTSSSHVNDAEGTNASFRIQRAVSVFLILKDPTRSEFLPFP